MVDAYSLPSPTNRKAQQAKTRMSSSKMFFYNGEAYSTMKVNRAMDVIQAFNFAQQEAQLLSYTDVVLRRERAWRTGEVERILHRSFVSFYRAWKAGVKPPFRARYEHRENSKVGFLWTDEDILRHHDHFVHKSLGRTPKDPSTLKGNNNLPSRAEVRARLKGEETVYVKNAKGEFVPTWKANQFGV